MYPQNSLNPKSTLIDSAASSTGRAVESTRQTANDALDSVTTYIDGLRGQAAPALDRVAEQASALANRSRQALHDGSQHLRQKAFEASDNTALYIRNEPFKAMAFAAAAGAVLVFLASWFGRSSERR